MKVEQEQHRVAVVDPGTRISFLFARSCPRDHAKPLLQNADAAALDSLLIVN